MKTILITGGARRLGRALVEHYAQLGWRVLFTVRHSVAEGRQLADDLGPNVHCLQTKVSSRANAAAIFNWVQVHCDRLDLLVCSASSFSKISFEDTNADDMQDLLESNVIGPYFLIQQMVPLLKTANGVVVNIADAQANSGVPHFSAYAAAKAALISITKSLAVELAPNVRVNAVLPGYLPWPETQNEYDDATRKEMTKCIPMQRTGTWNDIVQAVSYVQTAPYVNGACLPIDGGRACVY